MSRSVVSGSKLLLRLLSKEGRKMSGFGLPTKSAALRCARCRWWTGYDSTSTSGKVKIDTTCHICGHRLRHTRLMASWTWGLKTVAPANAFGSGGHNKSKSVVSCVVVRPGDGKKEASKLNKIRQRAIARIDGVDLDALVSKEEE